MDLECRLCKEDTPKRVLIKKRQQKEVTVSKENREKYGLIQETICKNIIKRRVQENCNNHMLKIKRGGM
jgi:hypothetical protein